jgi:transcription elongation factor Elf1
MMDGSFDLDFHCPACNMAWLVTCRVDNADGCAVPCHKPETECPLCAESGEMGRRRITKA